MFYAHKGAATDNAFTTANGQPTRTFYAFKTKAARYIFQANTWEESDHQQNVIFCKRAFIDQWVAPDFVVGHDGRIYNSAEEFYQEQQLNAYEHPQTE